MLSEVIPTGIALYGNDHQIKEWALVDADDHAAKPQSPGATSRYRGVSWRKREGKWQARVRTRGITRYAQFDTEEEAARAVSAWRQELFTHTVETRDGHCP